MLPSLLKIPLEVDKRQPEFTFAQPYITAREKEIQDWKDGWNNLFNAVRKCIPEGFDTSKIFDDIDLDESIDEKYCIPITVVLESPKQFVFPFLRAIDKKSWGFPVKYNFELDFERDLV